MDTKIMVVVNMAAVPANYVCVLCGIKGDHWIMFCNNLRLSYEEIRLSKINNTSQVNPAYNNQDNLEVISDHDQIPYFNIYEPFKQKPRFSYRKEKLFSFKIISLAAVSKYLHFLATHNRKTNHLHLYFASIIFAEDDQCIYLTSCLNSYIQTLLTKISHIKKVRQTKEFDILNMVNMYKDIECNDIFKTLYERFTDLDDRQSRNIKTYDYIQNYILGNNNLVINRFKIKKALSSKDIQQETSKLCELINENTDLFLYIFRYLWHGTDASYDGRSSERYNPFKETQIYVVCKTFYKLSICMLNMKYTLYCYSQYWMDKWDLTSYIKKNKQIKVKYKITQTASYLFNFMITNAINQKFSSSETKKQVFKTNSHQTAIRLMGKYNDCSKYKKYQCVKCNAYGKADTYYKNNIICIECNPEYECCDNCGDIALCEDANQCDWCSNTYCSKCIFYDWDSSCHVCHLCYEDRDTDNPTISHRCIICGENCYYAGDHDPYDCGQIECFGCDRIYCDECSEENCVQCDSCSNQICWNCKKQKMAYCSRCEKNLCKRCVWRSKAHKKHIKYAFLMGTHHRVGSESVLLKFIVNENIYEKIFSFL
eukprot:372653_1